MCVVQCSGLACRVMTNKAAVAVRSRILNGQMKRVALEFASVYMVARERDLRSGLPGKVGEETLYAPKYHLPTAR